MKVSGSNEHSPISLPKSTIHKIETIATTPNSRKAFQDGTTVVRSLSTAEVQIKCGESTEQRTISKVQYVNFLGVPRIHVVSKMFTHSLIVTHSLANM